ncbi:MAG: hypothetical protein SOT09_06255 [Candidatus Borkfalkiaceae bacterium]|nr:hypothetical protein [Christensenellaceae bacterium]
MSSWKKLLKEETERSVKNLKLSDEVRNAPVSVREKQETIPTKTGILTRIAAGVSSFFGKLFQKRAVAAALACAVCLCVAVPSVFAIINASKGEPCAVVLEINPGVLFLTDKKGNVTGVKSLNSDADVILADKNVIDELEGKPLAKSAEIFIDYALRLGFFDYESDENAIKFTAEKDLPFIEESVTAAENYFCEKGVYSAVIKDITSSETLSEKAGVTAAGNKLGSSASNLSVLYGARDVSDLKKAYDDNVVVGLYDLVKNKLPNIVEAAKRLVRMQIKNLKIMILTSKDYWSIKDEDSGLIVSALKENIVTDLKNDMEELIAKYSDLTGGKNEIVSSTGLSNAIYAYSELFGKVTEDTVIEDYITNIKEYFSSLTTDDFRNVDKMIVALLERTDVDTMGFESLTRVPETIKEYEKDLRKILSELYVLREKAGRENYSASREQISAESYAEYKNRILAEYGSFDNYWASIKK